MNYDGTIALQQKVVEITSQVMAFDNVRIAFYVTRNGKKSGR